MRQFSLNDVALVSKLSRLTLALAKKCWSKCGKQNPNAPVEQSAAGSGHTTSPQMNQILPTDQSSNSNSTILPDFNLIEQPSSQQSCLLGPSGMISNAILFLNRSSSAYPRDKFQILDPTEGLTPILLNSACHSIIG